MYTERLRHRGRAVFAAADIEPRRRSGGSAALAVSQAAFIVVTIALFVVWMTTGR
ncbi:MAG TPA: hypothetical protein VGH40_15445 [Roseiarcus sp.]